jgi:uroporphyrinogen decarboxylase
MNSRDRIKGILARDTSYDHYGIFEHYWPETVSEAWPAQGFPADAKPFEYFDLDLRGIHVGFDATTLNEPTGVIEESDEWIISENKWGARLRNWKHHSGTPEHIGYTIQTPEDWKPFRVKLEAGYANEQLDLDPIRAAHTEQMATEKYCVCGHYFVIETLRSALGDVGMFENMVLQPEWIHDINRTITDVTIAKFEHIFREVGKPHGIFLYEDLGFANGPFASPTMFDQIIFPYYRELVDFYHGHGLRVILHSCGGVTQLVPQLVDMGIDCLQPMEAKAGVDVLSLARLYGDRMAFMGNIDVTILNTNDRGRVREEVVGKLSALYDIDAHYVFHSDHSIPPDVNFETYRYAVDLYREFCVTHTR